MTQGVTAFEEHIKTVASVVERITDVTWKLDRLYVAFDAIGLKDTAKQVSFLLKILHECARDLGSSTNKTIAERVADAEMKSKTLLDMALNASKPD